MPYIKPSLRPSLDAVVQKFDDVFTFKTCITPGEMNYLITKLLLVWISSPSYAAYSAARGVLQDVADELYRKRVAPYEDKKCAENGEVY